MVKEVRAFNDEVQVSVKKGDLSQIGDLHSILSGLKTWYTWGCLESLETIR